MSNNNDSMVIDLKKIGTPLTVLLVIAAGFLGYKLSSPNNKVDAPKANVAAAQVEPSPIVKKQVEVNNQVNDGFLGDKGISVGAENGQLLIAEAQVNDGNMHAFNYYSESQGKTIYFFVVKASDGTYRAAANACEVCYGAKKGFTQVGDLIRCENCRVTYSKDKIALEKGGCNPGPINANVPVENGKLVLGVDEIEEVAYLF